MKIIPLPFRFPSFEALTAWWGTPFKEALQQLDPASRQRVQEKVQQAVCPFEGSQGIVAPGALLLGTAIK